MRILVVQESDWIERGPHQSHHLFERLKQRGHAIRIVDFDIGWSDRPRTGLVLRRKVLPAPPRIVEGAEFEVVRPSILTLPLLDYTSAFFTHRQEIRRQLKEFQPDIIVGLGILNAFSGIHLARRASIPFVYYLIDSLHELVPQRSLRGLARIVERWNVGSASLVLAINRSLRDYAISMGASEARVQVLPAGVDLERYRAEDDGMAVRRRLGFEPDDVVLFFMGWIYPFSGIREVIESLVTGEGREAHVKLLLVGKGDLWAELAKFVRDHGAENRVKMVEFRPFSEMPEYLAAASICLLPAQPVRTMLDIVPIKMYEYLASAKPVIATRLPGLVKEFGEGNGVVYVQSAVEVVAEAVELKRTGVLLDLGRKARAYVSSSEWNSITDTFEAILRDLVRKGRVGV